MLRFTSHICVVVTAVACSGGANSGAPKGSDNDVNFNDTLVAPAGGEADSGSGPAHEDENDAPNEAERDGTTSPSKLVDVRFAGPEAFSLPLAEYSDAVHSLMCGACSFTHDIFDLHAFGGKLHIAYGDATVNVGSLVPLPFLALKSPDDPNPEVGPVSGEEQFDRFREFGGVLYAAGVDATDDGWLGNLYTLAPGMDWAMHRNVPGGVHVHDVAVWKGEIYACGSGGTPEEWNAGKAYSHLWRAPLSVANVEVLERSLNTDGGDSRWTRLLPTDEILYIFGYKSNAAGNIVELPNRVWDGQTIAELPAGHPLGGVFVIETDAVQGQPPILRGVDVTASPLTNRVWWQVGGVWTPMPTFESATILDAFWHEPTAEWVVATREGNEYVNPPSNPPVKIWVGEDLDALNLALEFQPTSPLKSAAAWKGALWFGLKNGEIWRSLAHP